MRRLPALLAFALLAAGCDKGEPQPNAESASDAQTAPAAGPKRPIDPATVGALVGRVRFEGAAPERAPLAIGVAGGCHRDTPALSEAVIVEDGGLANVFVQVKKGLAGVELPPPPQTPVVLDQQGCIYVPHVVGLRVGQPLVVRNSDPTTHNVHFFAQRAGNPGGNHNQPQGTAEIETRFAAAEVGARAGCDLHPWMSSWISAVDHPFFAVSGTGGAFAIEGLPPGSYVLEAWHEVYGKQAIEVVVGERERKEVAFTFRAR